MENILNKFYAEFYRCTDGFIPTKPLGTDIYLGDLFVIQNGKILRLGNIAELDLVEPARYSEPIVQNPDLWDMNSGVIRSYVEEEDEIFEGKTIDDRQKYVLSFDSPGSYLFQGLEPTARLLLNFHEIEQALTIKVTQSEYMFREIYVATEVVELNSWILAISQTSDGLMEVSSNSDGFDLFGCMLDETSLVHRSHDLLSYRFAKESPTFFKAMRLKLHEKKREQLVNEAIAKHGRPWGPVESQQEDKFRRRNRDLFLANQLNIDPLNLANATSFNINTATDFFGWTPTTLTDVARLVNGGNV